MRKSAARSLAQIILAFGSIGAAGSGAVNAEPAKADSWERPAPANLRGCINLDKSLIVPVPRDHRPQAIAQLKNTSSVELTPRQMRELLELPAAGQMSGLDRLKGEVGRLEEQRRQALELRQGSWGNNDQQRLDDLRKAISEKPNAGLRPFLVRAVAKYEGTGAYFASLCGNRLDVLHGSLGHDTPPSIRTPVVVFLQSRPADVYVEWGMAD